MTKNTTYSLLKCSLVIVIVSLAQACTLKIPIDTPDVSMLSYNTKESKEVVQLNLKDNFDIKHQVSNGSIKINLVHNNTVLKASPFIFSSLKRELEARKLPVEYSDLGDNIIEFQEFEILNHMANGYSPVVTISTIKAELITKNGNKKISAMVKRGKVPVWSIKEINAPCYNEPVELLIKEIAAKINRELFGYSLNDEQVNKLVNKVNREANNNRLSYFDVYELGFSNNPKAIEPLKEFTKHKSEYIRIAAISSLGILGAKDFLENFKLIYKNAKLWQDRGMALKAIGDLGSNEAIEYLMQEKVKWKKLTTNEAKWNTLIIDLYI